MDKQKNAYKLSLTNKGSYLSCQVRGSRTLPNIQSIINEILVDCKKEKLLFILIDIRELKGRLDIYESYTISTKNLAKAFESGLIKKAVIVDAKDNRERFTFFEAIAIDHGFNVRVFDDSKRAVRWLTEPDK